jgi:hypothetical protein
MSAVFAATLEWLQSKDSGYWLPNDPDKDWPLDPENMEAFCRYSEQFPQSVVELIFGLRFPSGHLPLAAALRVPGFELLLEAHPQLAWLVAMVLWQRRDPQRPVPVADWAAVIRQGPLWLLKYFLRLPARRAVLEALRRLGFQMLEPQRLDDLLRVCRCPECMAMLVRLPAPIRPTVLDLLKQSILPQFTFVRALAANAISYPLGASNLCQIYADLVELSQRPLQLELFADVPNPLDGLEQRLRNLDSLDALFRMWVDLQTPDHSGRAEEFCVARRVRLRPPKGFPHDPRPVRLLLCYDDLKEAGAEFSNCLRIPIIAAQEIVSCCRRAQKLFARFEHGGAKALLTLQFMESPRPIIELSECLGPCNAAPPAALKAAIDTWLDRENQQLRSDPASSS